VVLTAVDVAGNEGSTSVDIPVELEDTGDGQSLPFVSIGLLGAGAMVAIAVFLLWFRKRK
jgi:LPXTG-motif cell wall-anchored protein